MLSKEKTATILFGPTQYGKSTFLDRVLHENETFRPKTGTGKGDSITRASHLYETTLIGPVLDVPGWNDTELLVDSALIAKQAALILAEGDVSSVRFLLFDSLSESSVQIRPTLEQLVQAFGGNAKDSVVVVACKLDRADEDELQDRLITMEETMEQCNIGNKLVLWKSKNLSAREWNDQLDELRLALHSKMPTTLIDIQDLKSRVLERAEKLYREQQPEMLEHKDKTTEPRVVDFVETEDYEDTDWEQVKVANSNMLIDKHVGAGIATYVLSLGIGFAIDLALHGGKPVYEWRPKKIVRQRKQNRQKIVYYKPVSEFNEQARIEILRETRVELCSSLPLSRH